MRGDEEKGSIKKYKKMKGEDEDLFFKHSFCYDCHNYINNCNCRISNQIMGFAQFSRAIKEERKRVLDGVKKKLILFKDSKGKSLDKILRKKDFLRLGREVLVVNDGKG